MPQAGDKSPINSGRIPRLITLGEAALQQSVDGDARIVFGPGKPLALLTYLALSPERRASRKHLIDLLWADRKPAAAGQALRQTVYDVRKRVSSEILETGNSDLALSGALRCDLDEFLEAIERGEFERAIEIYRGEFLPQFALPGGADFEQWADVERHRLRLLFCRVAESVTQRWLSEGRTRQAPQLARRVRDADLLNESGWRLYLEALLSAQDTVTALAEADRLERMLRDEGRATEPATREVLRLVRKPAEEAGRSTDRDGERSRLVAELIGREREFATVVCEWNRVRDGTTNIHIHVSGLPGLGKTRLLTDVHARLRALGANAVVLRAHPGQRSVPYSFAGDLARALAALPGSAAVAPAVAGTLVALNPTLSGQYAATADPDTSQEMLRRRTIAVGELITAVAEERALALLIDDVHWCDTESRQVLSGLLPRLAAAPALVVTTGRPVPHGTLAISETQTLTLAPLDREQIGRFLSSLGELPDDPWSRILVARLHEATEGSPLLLLESLELSLERGLLGLRDSRWECADPERLSVELQQGSALRDRLNRQLTRHQRRLLLLMSVAGTPLNRQSFADMAQRDPASVADDLAVLEQRGLATRAGTHWETAHDEVAAGVIEVATGEAELAAHAALGQHLVEKADRDPQQLIRAGGHLARSGHDALLHDVFRRYVRELRRRGDARPLRRLAVELSGRTTTDQTDRLVKALPLHVRLGLATPSRVAATTVFGIVSAAAVAAALAWPEGPPPDAILYAAVDGRFDSLVTAHVIPIHRERWTPHRPMSTTQRRGIELPRMTVEERLAARPGNQAWVMTKVFPDSGGIDLVLVTPDGNARRLTFAPGDDNEPDWSPDGRFVVFKTARWNEMSWYDLAVLDVELGTVRALVKAESTAFYTPRWSPDGTRIAYVSAPRGARVERPAELCVIGVDAMGRRCRRVSQEAVVPLGWLDPERLRFATEGAGGWILGTMNVSTGVVTPPSDSLELQTTYAVQSPDGRWMAIRLHDPERGRPRWKVFPIDAPELGRPLVSESDVFHVWWGHGTLTAGSYLDRVHVAAPPSGIPLNAPHRLMAVGLTPIGDTTTPRELRWTVAETGAAFIDSTGTLWPRDTGSTFVLASAGGWRRDSTMIRVTRPEQSSVLTETWEPDFDERWRTYGFPVPTRATGPEGVPALWSRGDHSFLSGAYSRRMFDVANGLGVKVLLSAPVNFQQWQGVIVGLMPAADSAALANWDHRTGSAPGSPRTTLPGCAVHYPEGLSRPDEIRLTNWPVATESASISADFTSGDWFALTLQILPDGTCAVAVDDQPVVRSEGRLPLDTRYRLYLEGQSWRTKTLHGPLEVWQGVRDDLDWRTLRPRMP